MPDPSTDSTTFNAVNITLRHYLFAQVLGNLASAGYAIRNQHVNPDEVVDLAWAFAISGEAKILSEQTGEENP